MQRTRTFTICDVCHEETDFIASETTDWTGRHVGVCEQCTEMDFVINRNAAGVVTLICGQCSTPEKLTEWALGADRPCNCETRIDGAPEP